MAGDSRAKAWRGAASGRLAQAAAAADGSEASWRSNKERLGRGAEGGGSEGGGEEGGSPPPAPSRPQRPASQRRSPPRRHPAPGLARTK